MQNKAPARKASSKPRDRRIDARTRRPNRLRELREAHGLKLYDISAQYRVDPSTVWRWERGGPVPDEIKLKLAKLYGTTVADMMGWPDQDAA